MGRKASVMPVMGETPIMTRDQASMAYHTKYFTGTLCSNGHLDWRYVSNGACRSCMKPPPPITPWAGVGNYRCMILQKLRLPVQPPLADKLQMQRFQNVLERAAQNWLISCGYMEIPKEDDDEA